MANRGDEWHKAVAERIGEAVAVRRKALGMTAQQLAERCNELGAPIHRTTITKIENGRPRFDLGELLILSVALDIPPALLVFPQYPDEGFVEVVPRLFETNETAVDWLAGRDVLTGFDGNAGTALVRILLTRNEIDDKWALADLDKDVAQASGKDVSEAHSRTVMRIVNERNSLTAAIRLAKEKLWGGDGDA